MKDSVSVTISALPHHRQTLRTHSKTFVATVGIVGPDRKAKRCFRAKRSLFYPNERFPAGTQLVKMMKNEKKIYLCRHRSVNFSIPYPVRRSR
jgi:hypothetical protein